MVKANKSGKTAPEQAHPAEDVICSIEEYNADVKKRFEERYNGHFKLIKFEEFLNIAPQFALWLKSVVRYGNVDSQILILWNLDEPERFRCLLYTNDHQYSITGYEGTEKNPKGYLGCTASTRKPRPGEDWNRGNDLPDGKYSKETFDKIIRGIVAYELKTIQLFRKK
jgi:hypothetical protein